MIGKSIIINKENIMELTDIIVALCSEGIRRFKVTDCNGYNNEVANPIIIKHIAEIII
jgi:hypothetical protein